MPVCWCPVDAVRQQYLECMLRDVIITPLFDYQTAAGFAAESNILLRFHLATNASANNALIQPWTQDLHVLSDAEGSELNWRAAHIFVALDQQQLQPHQHRLRCRRRKGTQRTSARPVLHGGGGEDSVFCGSVRSWVDEVRSALGSILIDEVRSMDRDRDRDRFMCAVFWSSVVVWILD